MATSGTYLFNPEIAEFVEDALGECGVTPEKITDEHLGYATRQINRMLVEWSNRGFQAYEAVYTSAAVAIGEGAFLLPADALDVTIATWELQNTVVPMTRISREDYQFIPSKGDRGMPDRYWVDRGVTDATTRRYVYIWPTPQAGGTVRYWYKRRAQDVTTLAQNAAIPYEWQDAFASGLAARLARKYAPARLRDLSALAEASYKDARYADSDDADVTFYGVEE